MADREYLTSMIQRAVGGTSSYWAGLIADYLLAHGVTIPVRCNDCEHFAEAKGKDSGKPCGYGQCKRPTGIRGIVCVDDFCGFGERRDSE